MDIKLKLSNIDFSVFIGQQVVSINPVGIELVNIKFNNGSLNIECSWRIRNEKGVLVAYTDTKREDNPCSKNALDEIQKQLANQIITNIYHFEPTEDLIIEFNNTILLDLFIDTTIYESYQIHYRDRIFLIGR